MRVKAREKRGGGGTGGDRQRKRVPQRNARWQEWPTSQLQAAQRHFNCSLPQSLACSCRHTSRNCQYFFFFIYLFVCLSVVVVVVVVAGDAMGVLSEKLAEALSIEVTAEQAVKNLVLAGKVLEFTKQLPSTPNQMRWAEQANALLQAGMCYE